MGLLCVRHSDMLVNRQTERLYSQSYRKTVDSKDGDFKNEIKQSSIRAWRKAGC